jgi:hypothetical protein
VKCAVSLSNYYIYAQIPESCVPPVTRWFTFFRKVVLAPRRTVDWRCLTGLDMVRLPTTAGRAPPAANRPES